MADSPAVHILRCVPSLTVDLVFGPRNAFVVLFLQVKHVLAELEWADSASHDESCTLASVIANVCRSVL